VEQQGSYVLIPEAVSSRRDLCDFAVVMHRLPAERMMHQMVATGLMKLADIQELASKLVIFHAKASIGQSKLWGSPPALARLMINTVAEAERLATDTVTRKRLETKGEYTRHYVMTHLQFLGQRVLSGRVCEGHGDLRCDSM